MPASTVNASTSPKSKTCDSLAFQQSRRQYCRRSLVVFSRGQNSQESKEKTEIHPEKSETVASRFLHITPPTPLLYILSRTGRYHATFQ
jgi:hypothetical protein